MDEAAASRRAKPNRGRPLVPPNYVSLRVLQELRQREKEERRRREEEEAAARREREEQRKRQEEEEEAAARRFVEERRRREEEAAAARRARDAAAPRPEMRASSSSHTSSSFSYNERACGGQRLVVVADRPPPQRATGGCRGNKGLDGGASKAQNLGKVSAGVLAGPGEPEKPATASCHAGKPEEKRKEEASGCQGTASVTSSASGPARPKHRNWGNKKDYSGGRRTGMAPSTNWPDGMEPQPCPTTEGSDSQRSSSSQGTSCGAKTEGVQGKQAVVEVKVQPHPAAESRSYLRSSGDQGMIHRAKSEDSKEKQRVVDMRTAAQLKPRDMRNSGRQRPGGHSGVNVAARQHDMIWVPKGAAMLDSAEVGK